ncbi:hypothetical protein AHF37_09716 [Paragonimus kellicotti]|nr:hypothetical protein AHF37_09716 [Paragonimus kellicotti]
MWEELERTGNQGVAIDRSASLYCGYAAGRPAEGTRKKDHACSDRLDVLGSWQKCVQACSQALAKGTSVVVDNTNMDVESRARYLEVARAALVPVRCFVMQVTVEHAKHNERFRVLTDSAHKPIGPMVFNTLK